MATLSSSSPSLFSWMLGAKPPSSPTLVASCPYFFLITDFKLWYTSLPICIASLKDEAPVGRIMNSCMASLLPACEPPLMTLSAGTGSTSSVLPARLAMCWYSGIFFTAAPARHSASDTARMELAPSFCLHHPHSFCVPSSSCTMRLSMAVCSVGSLPTSAGAMVVWMLFTALDTPLPMNFLPPSLSSRASYTPVDAPLGTAALWNEPSLRCTSHSTVGFPLLS
ncbi:hypothetical protein Mapa_012832 [Marchantia paleacea]|nr:hypothetical protein Mapa_012832 [Marchantia paleacea]